MLATRWHEFEFCLLTLDLYIIYYSTYLLPPFLNICLSKNFNKWLHTEQNEWIYTLKYVYIHLYVVVHLKSLKRQIFRNGGSNIYFFRYCTDSGTHRVLRILRMDLFLFNFLYEAVATLQVMCTLYMQLTFYRGRIIHAINSNGLDVTLLFPA